MDFESFVSELLEKIPEHLSEERRNDEISVIETRKLNDAYPALVIRGEDETVVPSIDLGMLFEDYKNGHSMDSIAEHAVELSLSRPEGIDIDGLMDYEKAKERLFIRISDAEANRELLENVPHKEEAGLAITYHVLAMQNGEELGSTMVNNQLLETFGVTPEQLHRDALENSPKIFPPSFLPMEVALGRLMDKEMELEMEVPQDLSSQIGNVDLLQDGMAVLSNRQGTHGAAALFYPDVMKAIGDRMQVDMFVLPSSTHEVILVADTGNFQREMLESMVQEINSTEVSPKDKLSDTVYHYDSREHRLEKAEDYETRMAERAKQKREKAMAR